MMLAAEPRPVDLDAIAADVGVLTAGRIENAAGTAGVLLSGTKPGGWVRGLDLTATGTEPFLFHDGLELLANGDATFFGQLDVVSPQLSIGGVNDAWERLRIPSLDTDVGITPVDIAAILTPWSATLGGLHVYGISEGDNRAVVVQGVVGSNAPTVPALTFRATKRSAAGGSHGTLGDDDIIAAFDGGATTKVAVRGDGVVLATGVEIDDGSTNPARVPGIVVSTAAASGDYPEGTLWLRV